VKNVIDLGKDKTYPITGELAAELNKVVERFNGRLSVVECVGTLEMVKMMVMDNAKNNLCE